MRHVYTASFADCRSPLAAYGWPATSSALFHRCPPRHIAIQQSQHSAFSRDSTSETGGTWRINGQRMNRPRHDNARPATVAARIGGWRVPADDGGDRCPGASPAARQGDDRALPEFMSPTTHGQSEGGPTASAGPGSVRLSLGTGPGEQAACRHEVLDTRIARLGRTGPGRGLGCDERVYGVLKISQIVFVKYA